MKDFFETTLCKSGDVCLKCRRSSTYRKGIIAAYDNPSDVDFACPVGKTAEDYPVEVEPNIFQMGRNLASSLARELRSGGKPSVSEEEIQKRLAICEGCEFLRNGTRCTKCGCVMKFKARLNTGECPIGKW